MAYVCPRISTSTRFMSAIGIGPSAEIELVQLLENAVHLRQHVLALLLERQELRPLGFHGREPGLERVALLLQQGDGLHRPLHRFFQLGHPLRQVLHHYPPLTSALKRVLTSATILAWSSLTSLSRSVRSGAWK